MSSFLSLVDFARLTQTNRSTLLYYEKIGILSSIKRAKNNYRLYSHIQLATMNLIHTCKYLRMNLPEIAAVCIDRSPELIISLLDKQMSKLEYEKKRISDSYEYLETLKETISSAMTVDTSKIVIQYAPAETILIGSQNDYSNGRNAYDALFSFYLDSNIKYPDLDITYTAWGMFTSERVKRHDWVWPDRYYFLNPDGNAEKPAELYATGYQRGGYGQTSELYERILRYIDENGFEISGPAFEEYPLNEICEKNENEYLIRVMITVRKK
jgi:DNA-binding transcriptional MerR regulator